jgi:hypothetical protein
MHHCRDLIVQAVATACRQIRHSIQSIVLYSYCLQFFGFILAIPNVANAATAATSMIHCHDKSLAKYTQYYDDRHTYTKCNCHCPCALLVLSSVWSVRSSFRPATWHRSFDQNYDSQLAGSRMDMIRAFIENRVAEADATEGEVLVTKSCMNNLA